MPLKLIAEVSRGPGRHCCCFLILPTVIFLLGKVPHNSSEVSQDPRAEAVLSNESAVGLKGFMQTIKMILFVPVLGIGLIVLQVLYFPQQTVESVGSIRDQLKPPSS